MKFKVQDLGGLMATKITESGFILGAVSAGGNSADAVLRPDGTMVTLPSGIGRARHINDAGLVLCRDELEYGPNVWLFDSATSTTEMFSMPGFHYVWPEEINIHGDVAGSIANEPDRGDRRGFVRSRQSGAISWTAPTIASPPGAVSYIYLNAINDQGHAVGTQGWRGGSTWAEVPIFFDGTVHQIRNPTAFAEGDLITSNDRMRVSFAAQGLPASRAIYDLTTDTLTPFPYGAILDMTASAMILSQEGNDYFFRFGGVGHPLAPSLSGWSSFYARSLNNKGLIVGYGSIGGVGHGFLLMEDPYASVIVPPLAAKILLGIINDAGGVEIVGRVLRRIPPHAPVTAILDVLPRDLAEELRAIVDTLPPTGPIQEQRFSSQLRSALVRYQRNQRHR